MPPVQVTAAVLERDGLILIAQRNRGALAGYWEFPGGKLEPAETPEAALQRELQEELGIEAQIGSHVLSTVHHYPHLSVELLVYRATITGGEPEARDHADLKWVTLSQLRNYPLAPADWPVVAALEKS